MADDERPDARDPQVARWLEVEPLDDVTRRRLVSGALRESTPGEHPTPRRVPQHLWRWIAAAAVVVVLVVGVALLGTGGGGDTTQASRDRAVGAPGAHAPTRDVGDFGDLAQPTNLAALRAALAGTSAAGAAAPSSASSFGSSDASTSPRSGNAQSQGAGSRVLLCGASPDGTIVAQGTGTLGGRHATVLLVETPAGTKTYQLVLEDPCEVRDLP
jgi:hypothetical protein